MATSKKEPQAVADKVLKRAELSKMARNLQNRLALAQFKTKHGWEDLTLDKIEPKVEEEIRRRRALEGNDALSDSSSSTSDLPPYPSARVLMSSPFKAPPPLFSDAITGPSSSSGSTGHRKRTYHALDSYNATSALSSPTKRVRPSPTAHRSASSSSLSASRSATADRKSPVKKRRSHQFLPGTGEPSFLQSQPNFNAPLSDSEDDTLLPAHSFNPSQITRSSPPRTPPPQPHTEPSSRATHSEEGADLLLYLAASPSPAPKKPGGLKAGNNGTSTLMEPPSTPPSRVMRSKDAEKTPALPSSMMTPGGLFPTTPGPAFDLADFVNITPSPAQKPWKTPLAGPGRTPRLGTARGTRLIDDMP